MNDKPFEVLVYYTDIKDPKRKTLKPDRDGSVLKSMQDVVHGYIEVIRHPVRDDLCIVVNEEGKLKDSRFNRLIFWLDKYSKLHRDFLFDDFLICRHSGDDLVSLTEDDVKWLVREDHTFAWWQQEK